MAEAAHSYRLVRADRSVIAIRQDDGRMVRKLRTTSVALSACSVDQFLLLPILTTGACPGFLKGGVQYLLVS